MKLASQMPSSTCRVAIMFSQAASMSLCLLEKHSMFLRKGVLHREPSCPSKPLLKLAPHVSL